MNRVSIAQLKDAGLCPEWLAEAQTKDAVVSIDDTGDITWHKGIWEGGVWEKGTWQSGIWRSGTWKNGMWRGGTWECGVWVHGVWVHEVFLSGVVKAGLFTYNGGCAPLSDDCIVLVVKGEYPIVYTLKDKILTIGCRDRTEGEWDAFFDKDCTDVLETPRDTDKFRRIRDNYAIAKLIIKQIESARK